MKKTTLIRRVYILFFAITISGLSWSQSALYKVSLDEQIRNSDAVIEGKVLSKSSFWDVDGTNIYTVNTIEVFKAFKGNIQPTIEIITSGGIVGTEMEIVSPSLNLNVKDVGVFLLKNNTRQLERSSSVLTFQSTSSVQGFYKYDIESDIAMSPTHIIEGITSKLYADIQTETGQPFQDIIMFNANDVRNEMTSINSRSAMGITNISPSTITAGTKSAITITGTGFGTVAGDVGFSNSDYGGMLYHDALESQIISWSDTEIIVEVPDKAGTGDIRITHDDTSTLVSSSTITVDYAHSNVEYTMSTDQEAYFLQHVGLDGSGGLEWQLFTDFDANSDAKAAFERSLDTWRCDSKINWNIGSTTTVDVIANDGVNVVRFDNGSELPGGVLGRCTSRFSGCFDGMGGIDWYVTELDIAFNDATNWNFSTGLPSGSQYDFETVSVHELGHGHQLGHVIDSGTIMHYSVSNGVAKRDLDQNDIDGGTWIQNRSSTNQVCSQPLMANSTSCSLSTDDNVLENSIAVYPNPATTIVNISNNSPITINQVDVIDINGRLILSQRLDNSSGVDYISVNQLRSGIYFFRIIGDNATAIKKIIIN